MSGNQEDVTISNEEQNLRTESGNEATIQLTGNTFMVDAHMHIQSVNGTPLTMQWATSTLQITAPQAVIPKGERLSLNNILAGKGATGIIAKATTTKNMHIGIFATDTIGKIYSRVVNNSEIKSSLLWMNAKIRDNENLSEGEKKEKLGDNLKLNDLSQMQNDSITEFECRTTEYYTNFSRFQMSIAHTMDFSFAHFWGLHRIPIMLNNPKDNTYYYINNYQYINVDHIRNNVKLTFDFIPLKNNINNQHLFADYPINEAFNSFKVHIEDAIQDSNYFNTTHEDYNSKLTKLKKEFDKLKKPYFRIDDIKSILDSNGTPEEKSDKIYQCLREINDHLSLSSNKKYFHYLTKVPGDDLEMFEDYSEQLNYYAATAYRSPMKFLPFYNFDPRRHFDPNIVNESKIVSSIVDNHDFLRIEDSEGFNNTNRVNLDLFEDIDSDYFDKYLFKGLKKTNGRSGISQFKQAPLMTSIDEAKHFIFGKDDGAENTFLKAPPHIFWGVKMYPPLGYSPALYREVNSRYGLPEGFYDHLDDWFAYCTTNNIPITAHGTAFGMNLGDSFNYIKNDYESTGTSIPKYSKKEQAGYMDMTNTHVDCWKTVLDDHPQLTFCFAHFGSYDLDAKTWENPMKNNEAEEKRNDKYDWRKRICNCLQDYDNVYSDLSFTDIKPRNIAKIGKNIIDAMTKHSKLKDKLLAGTDWYMDEMHHKGSGEMHSLMFDLLVYMSTESGDECDYWHQFSVINPLKFLGLISDDKTDSDSMGDYYILDKEKINKYIDKLSAVENGDYIKWRKQASLNDLDVKTIPKIIEKLKEGKFSTSSDEGEAKWRIYTGEVMYKRFEDNHNFDGVIPIPDWEANIY